MLILRSVLLCFIFVLMAGCSWFPTREEMRQEIISSSPELQEYYKKKDSIKIVPKEGESKMEALLRERQETQGEIERAKQEIKDNEAKLKAVDVQIKQERIDRMQYWAYLVGGISLALGLLCFIGMFLATAYQPLPKILAYSALSLGGIGALSFAFAVIVPYLTIIGLSLLAILIASAAFFWFKDRKSLTQVVDAVNNVKDKVPNFKDEFNKVIDSDVDKHVDSVREKLKKVKEKMLNKK